MRFKEPVSIAEFRGETGYRWSWFETIVVVAFGVAWAMAVVGCGQIETTQDQTMNETVDSGNIASDGSVDQTRSESRFSGPDAFLPEHVSMTVTLDGQCSYNPDIVEGARCPGPVYSSTKICVACKLKSTGDIVARCEWTYDVCVQDCNICSTNPMP